MIRDGAAPSWTSLMRDVAKEIADDAHDPDPKNPLRPGKLPWSALRIEGYEDRDGEWHDGLAEICGATPRAISDALTALARAGYEMRQAITNRDGDPVTDKRGRILYAAKGHALRFHVPPLPPRRVLYRSHSDVTFNGFATVAEFLAANLRSHPDASNDDQRSHPDVSKVAPGCDPVPHASPNVKVFPQAAAARLAEDQGQTQDQDQRRVGDGVDDKQHPVGASTGTQSNSVAKSQNRRLHNGPDTQTSQAPQFPLHDSDSTTTGSCAREGEAA